MSRQDYHNIQFDDRYSAFIQNVNHRTGSNLACPWRVEVFDGRTPTWASRRFGAEEDALRFAEQTVNLLRANEGGAHE